MKRDDAASSDFVANISNNAIIEIAKTGRILFYNDKAACVFSGASVGLQLRKIVSTKVWNILLHNIEMAFYHQYPHHFYLNFHSRFYLIYVYPKDVSVWLTADDITEKRKLAHLLHISGQRIKFAEEKAKTGYWELDLVRKQFYWSDEVYKIFDVDNSKDSHHRNLVKELLHPEDLLVYKQKIRELVSSHEDIDGLIRIITKKKQLKYCKFAAGITYENGETKIAGVFQDITELMRIQEYLEMAKRKAEEENLAKSYFLAQASHDIRQPLQAITLFAEGLKNARPSEYTDIIAKINCLTENLAMMLNNLLDFAKIEAGTEVREKEYFDLSLLLKRIVEEFMQTTEKHIVIKYREKKMIVYQDVFSVERIIRNLLSNAVKYAKSKVLVGNDDNSFWITDDGCGIDENKKKHIFDAFYQCDLQNDKKRGGIGLGLNIVKKISDLIGAVVTVKSKVRKFTIFKVRL